MSALSENVSVSNCTGFYNEFLCSEQMYSPSRLYSLVPITELAFLDPYFQAECRTHEEFLLIFNYATNSINKYAMFTKMKIRMLFWLADHMLVAITHDGENEMKQILMMVDHNQKAVIYGEEKIYSSNIAALCQPLTVPRRSFVDQLPCTTVGNKEYFFWTHSYDPTSEIISICLMPKLLSSRNDEAKVYHVKIGRNSPAVNVVCSLLGIPASTTIVVESPEFSHGSKLLCQLTIRSHQQGPISKYIFGVYISLDLEKLTDLFGKNPDQSEIEQSQETAISPVFLPRQRSITMTSFHRFIQIHSCTIIDNQLLMRERGPGYTGLLHYVNFNTLEYTLSIQGAHSCRQCFSFHPSGFLLIWYIDRNKISYRKVDLSLKSTSLQDAARKKILLGQPLDLHSCKRLRRIIFPGSEFEFKANISLLEWDTVRAANSIPRVSPLKPRISLHLLLYLIFVAPAMFLLIFTIVFFLYIAENMCRQIPNAICLT